MSRRNPTPEEWVANSLPFESALSTIELDYSFLYTHFFDTLLRTSLHIFEVENVPDSVNYEFMKMCIIVLGRTCFFDKFEGKLIAMNCAPAGKPDLYYVPENLLITNPRFNRSYNLKIGSECEIVYCTTMDPYYWGRGSGGLYSLISSTASLLADNYLSLNIAQKNTRLTNAFAADDENTVQSLNACMEEAYEGRPFLVVQKSLIDKLETLPMTNTTDSATLIQMLDIHKYILSEFYAAIGLQEAQQMKRERLITAEVEDGAELPLFNIHPFHNGQQRIVIEVHIGQGSKQSFHDDSGSRITDNMLVALSSTGQTDQRTGQLVLKFRCISLFTADTHITRTGLAASGLFTLKTKHSSFSFT